MTFENSVNHPDYYRNHEFECIDEMVAVLGKEAVIDFCNCNIWKYRYRAGNKGDGNWDEIQYAEDMKKADWYMKKSMELQGNGFLSDRAEAQAYGIDIFKQKPEEPRPGKTCDDVCQGAYGDCETCPIQEAFDLLNEYQATGLTPEEVRSMKGEHENLEAVE